jgi:transcriptional regulator with XRE-family HTH domain
MPERKTIIQTILDTIRARGLSGYRVSKETGISQGGISRFLRGERMLSAEGINKVCEYLGLELVERKKKK